MDELSIIFSSAPTRDAFVTATIAFMLCYVIGFVILRQWARPARWTHMVRHAVPAMGGALVAAVAVLGVHWTAVRAASAEMRAAAVTISPAELHRASASLISLIPVSEVREPF